MALYTLSLKLVALCALVHEAAAFANLPPSPCKEGDLCVLGTPGACCSGTRDPPISKPPLRCVPPLSPDLLPTCQYDTSNGCPKKGDPCDPFLIDPCCSAAHPPSGLRCLPVPIGEPPLISFTYECESPYLNTKCDKTLLGTCGSTDDPPSGLTCFCLIFGAEENCTCKDPYYGARE